MLDIKYVREHLDEVAETMKNRHASFDPEQFTALDVQRREVIAEEEALQAERNKLSKEIGALMGQGKTDEANATKETVRQINEKLTALGDARAEAEAAMDALMLSIPNMVDVTTPRTTIPRCAAGARPAISPPRASNRRPIGIWGRP